MTIKTDVRAIARIAGADDPAPLAPWRGQAAASYSLRLRWMTDDYARMRNAAWLVRASRVGAAQNPIALQLVVQEAEKLALAGEPLIDIFEAFAELLRSP